MAKSKQTIARFIDEYEGYLSSIQSSISRVEQERREWQNEQKELEKNWAGAPVVADLVQSQPQSAWWDALKKTTDPKLAALRQNAEEVISQTGRRQQSFKDSIQECTRIEQELNQKLSESNSMVQSSQKLKDTASAVLQDIKALRESFHDSALDFQFKKWGHQSVVARSPLVYDYAKPQPWWAKPWLLAVINPAMGYNMQDAKNYQRQTGKNLYEAMQGYEQRKQTYDYANAEFNEAYLAAKHVSEAHTALTDARKDNHKRLEASISNVLPETGPQSLKSQTDHVRATAIERTAHHCIMNNISHVGGLDLKLPDAQDYAQRLGKLTAIQKVTESLQQTSDSWRKGEKSVSSALIELNRLARKHNRHTKIGVDTSKTQEMARTIEERSSQIHRRFRNARPAMRQSTPFASQSFASSNAAMHTTSTSNANDSMFWSMAWMYLLMSPSASHGTQTDANTHAPLLDQQQFEHDFHNANGGLGLVGDASFENFSLSDIDASFDVDRPNSGSGFSIDASDLIIDSAPIQVEVDAGSSWSSSPQQDTGSSWSSSPQQDTGSSWSSSPQQDTGSSWSAPAPAPDTPSMGSSCGSSCGGGSGGGD